MGQDPDLERVVRAILAELGWLRGAAYEPDPATAELVPPPPDLARPKKPVRTR